MVWSGAGRTQSKMRFTGSDFQDQTEKKLKEFQLQFCKIKPSLRSQ